MYFKRFIKEILPIDLIVLGYILVTSIFILFAAAKLQDVSIHLAFRVFFTGAILLLAYLDKIVKNKFVHFIRHFYPLLLLLYFFMETNTLHNVFFYDLDPYVANLEVTIFGMHPSIWFSHVFPWKWFNELMNFGYFSFYPMIILLCLILYFKNKANFMIANFVICMSFLMYYLIYILFPVAGPQFYFTAPDNQIPVAYLFSHLMKFIQDFGDRPTAAFPSSHVGITCIVVYLSYKYYPKLLKWYIPLGIILVLSTVYIKAHYAIDVIAGFLTVPTMYWISSRTYLLISNGLSEEYKIHNWYDRFILKCHLQMEKFKKKGTNVIK